MRLFFDYNAGSPLRPEALAAMLPHLRAGANASSVHREGSRARQALEQARREVAALVGAAPAQVVFTSGGTEANNLALRGALAARGPGAHLVTTAVEHSSVLETARALERSGLCALSVVGVDSEGRVRAEDVLSACREDTVLVSIGLANAETGALQPVAEIASGLGGRGVLVHTDAVQAAGRVALDVGQLGVDLLTLSAHKLGGPQGAGALVVRTGVELVPQLTGGPQERGRRAGTEAVALQVGFGAAAAAAAREREEAGRREAVLVERLWEGIRRAIPDALRNGPAEHCLPNTLNVSFPGASGESLAVALDIEGVAVSTGSACAAGAPEPSHVLLAMGRTVEEARSAVRFSLGPGNTMAEVERLLDLLPPLVERARAARGSSSAEPVRAVRGRR